MISGVENTRNFGIMAHIDAGKTSTLSVKTENTTETPSFKSSNTKVATVNKTTGKITAK